MTKFKHGDRVTCAIMGRYIEDARINLNQEFPTICQNIIDGGEKCDHLGYNFTYSFRDIGDIKNLELKEKTLDDLEVGDILVTSAPDFYKGRERKVLAICGLVYFLSGVDTFTKYDGGYTIEEIKYMHTLKKEEEPEVPEELTMAELEKELGRKVKIIK